MHSLKQQVVRGGFVRVCTQAATLILRVGSLMVLARLLDPSDFGLVAMVTAITGILGLFKEAGLSLASVQSASITEEQSSTLFWINLTIGVTLGLLLIALTPLIVQFYREPRLFWIAMLLALQFPFVGAAAQHSARLQRHMRFGTLAAIDIFALTVSIILGVSMASFGWGYWAIVGQSISLPGITAISVIMATGWIPGRPRRDSGVGSLLRFGGIVSLNGVIVYVGYNLDKILLGRFWGADALGLYGRAYQLVSIPIDSVYSSMSPVAMASLSRLQDDPERLRNYFLKGYSLMLAVTLPTTIACALLADDLILVVLGPRWIDAVQVFRLLTPTILVFGLINPLSWLMFSLGLVGRSLRIGTVIAVIVTVACLLGLPHGPTGVALAYSLALSLWVLPDIAWCLHGTKISILDLGRVVSRPLVSGVVAAVFTFAVRMYIDQSLSALLRLLVSGGVLMVVYGWMLMYVMGQRMLFVDVLRDLTGRSLAPATSAH